jgi:hypothetical protein
MGWRKLGRVWGPDQRWPWALSHAANPVAEPLGGDRFRVYFATRDARSRSHIGALEFDLQTPCRIVDIRPRPVLAPGRPGAFDDSGVIASCLVRRERHDFLYYLGWNLGVTVPWRNSIGIAVREHGSDEFHRLSPAPALDRNREDPFSLSYPWVMRDESGWRMWYGSNQNWGARAEDMAHVIKYAESDDGISWRPTGRVCIGFEAHGEYAIARPCVVKDGAIYRMWYSYRGLAYQIGYAESADGLDWRRCDACAGIEPSADGWDSISLQYPFVFDHKGVRYMLYNGRDYGRTGFGLARWCED